MTSLFSSLTGNLGSTNSNVNSSNTTKYPSVYSSSSSSATSNTPSQEQQHEDDEDDEDGEDEERERERERDEEAIEVEVEVARKETDLTTRKKNHPTKSKVGAVPSTSTGISTSPSTGISTSPSTGKSRSKTRHKLMTSSTTSNTSPNTKTRSKTSDKTSVARNPSWSSSSSSSAAAASGYSNSTSSATSPVLRNEAIIELIPDLLYYLPESPAGKSMRGMSIRKDKQVEYMCTDNSLVYWNFFLDFGPMNLGQTYVFCETLKAKLDSARKTGKKVVYYSSSEPQKRANSVYLISAFMMLVMKNTPEAAIEPCAHLKLPPFHDASPFDCDYHLNVLDCLRGIDKARRFGFFNYDTFDLDEYMYYERVENGDLNWLFPGKFLAFAGPHDVRSNDPYYPTSLPEDYIDYFKRKNVTTIIRLNKRCYDERRFIRAGFKHVDIFYTDGSCPPRHLLDKFLEICETTKGAIAVHCKAGLGRTGTCIGCYAMKHYGFTAAEVIGWMRVCRPGSVIGPQQQYMETMQVPMWKAGAEYRRRRNHPLQAANGVATPPSKAVQRTTISPAAPEPKYEQYTDIHEDYEPEARATMSTPPRKAHNNDNSPSAKRDGNDGDDVEEEEEDVERRTSQGDQLRMRKSPGAHGQFSKSAQQAEGKSGTFPRFLNRSARNLMEVDHIPYAQSSQQE